MFLYLTIYMQGVLDFSPLEAGLRFLPLTVLGFVVAPIAGALSNRIPIRVLLGTGLAAGRGRPAADARRLARLGVDDAAASASSSPASASASPTPASARRRSRSCRWRNRGWDRGSTRPSARSGSRPASPGSAPSSSRGSTRSCPNCCRTRRLASAKWSPRAARAASAALPLPPAIHAKAVHAADVAFVSGFNEIILIAAILSFVGAALGFVLVRSRDFVQPTAGAAPSRPPAEPATSAQTAASRSAAVATQDLMLRELRIENLLLIERAELRLGEGLNAITGETGAGKTVLAHSLDLLMGGKAKAQIVRPGRRGGLGRGRLRPARGAARGAGAGGAGRAAAGGRRGGRAGTAGLGRRADQRLRRRARGDGRRPEAARRPAARLLRPARAPQADDLLGPAGGPRRLRRGRAPGDAAALPRGAPRVRPARRRAGRAARARRARGSATSTSTATSSPRSRRSAPDPEERAELAAERERLRHAEGLRDAAAGAHAGPGRAPRRTAAARRRRWPRPNRGCRARPGSTPASTRSPSGSRRWRSSSATSARSCATTPRASRPTRRRCWRSRSGWRRSTGSSASTAAASSRCSPTPSAAGRRSRGSRAPRCAAPRPTAALAEAEARRGELGEKLSAGRADGGAAAGGAGRRRAGAALDGRCARSRSCSSRTPTATAPAGRETVELRVAPNPGIEAAPLRDAASGGELSRVMLALSGLGQAASAGTLVFDEIDAGIGGNTARVVGERLRALGAEPPGPLHHPPAAGRLARRRPLPAREGRRRRAGRWPRVERLDGEGVVEEIRRMLGGENADEAATRHARELLAAA